MTEQDYAKLVMASMARGAHHQHEGGNKPDSKP